MRPTRSPVLSLGITESLVMVKRYFLRLSASETGQKAMQMREVLQWKRSWLRAEVERSFQQFGESCGQSASRADATKVKGPQQQEDFANTSTSICAKKTHD
jgi:hypothetical protein